MINRPRLFVSIPGKQVKKNPLTPLSDPNMDELSPLDQLKMSWTGVTIQETMDGIIIYTDTMTIPSIIYSVENKSRVVKNKGIYYVYIRAGFSGRLRVLTHKCHIVLFEDIITSEHYNNATGIDYKNMFVGNIKLIRADKYEENVSEEYDKNPIEEFFDIIDKKDEDEDKDGMHDKSDTDHLYM